MISPEALYATKRAVNRGADAAGFRTAIYAGLDVVGPLYATKTEFGTKFREMVATEGVPAAVRWRAAQFKEFIEIVLFSLRIKRYSLVYTRPRALPQYCQRRLPQ